MRQLQGDPLEKMKERPSGWCETSTAAERMLEITRRRSCAGVKSSFWWKSLLSGGLELRAWERTS